jgi:Ser/Thr protein kinase RdoA (MazF antagonist)
VSDGPAAPPQAVIDAYGLRGTDIGPLAGGLINTTFVVREGGEPRAVVQRLHPVFGGAVNLDLEAVTAHVARRGLETPRLRRTRAGAAWLDLDGRVWRALSWVEGVAVHAVTEPALAEAGGALVGRFHRAIADLEHDYQFTRAGVHDTAAHLGRLRAAAAQPFDGAPELRALLDEARALAHEILTAAAALPPIGDLPRRHSHGDLKLSNLLFRGAPPTGVCLVDLDTLGRQTIAFELGDAMRSWCNPSGEDVTRARFDLAIFAAAMRGYREVAGALLAPAEWPAIVTGCETVCLELAARFCTDVFEDRYFGWDATRFPSRRAHDLVRARGQLALGRDLGSRRADAHAIVRGA